MTMIPPLVSIIIPAFGRIRYLSDALHSALAQSYPATEIIVIDDNGADTPDQQATAALMAEPEFANITYLVNPVNLGVAASRNRAAHEAKGQYLTFLDDDDVMMPGKVAQQMQCVDEAPFCLTAYEETDAALAPVRIQHQPNIHTIEEFLTHKVFSQATTLLIEKALFERVGGFPEDLSYREDTLLVMKALAKSGCLCTLDEPLFKHRVHDQARLSRRQYSLEERTYIHRRWCAVQDALLLQVDQQTANRIRFEREYNYFKACRKEGVRFDARYVGYLARLGAKGKYALKIPSVLFKSIF